ncbi:hypothetical protein AURDEDRAFT_186454 [Auricularia subglabra TFB-10046 SS5]|nr:hypothetical protein AURDEDRAFT_186454 [Auricularia subglabra TFB-10046 SS5]
MPSVVAPPSYSPSSAAPCYSAVPHPEELSLTRTTRAHPHRATRIVVLSHESKSHPFSTSFLHQQDAQDIPTYQRGDVIDGFVQLHNAAAGGTVRVSVKLLGQTQLCTGSGGKHTFPFLQCSYDLWHLEGPEDSQVPDHLDFSVPFPTHVDDDGVERLLPSSTRAEFCGPSAIVEYVFRVSVYTKGLGGMLKKTHTLSTPIKYTHRTHPPRAPLGSEHTFLSTIKVAPEEWAVIETTLPVVRTSRRPMSCAIAIPASRIYHTEQPIPIHIQLTGDEETLQQFAQDCGAHGSPHLRAHSQLPAASPPASPNYHHLPLPDSPAFSFLRLESRNSLSSDSSSQYLSVSSASSRPSSACSSRCSTPYDAGERGSINVRLQRRVAIDVQGEKTWRVQTLSPAVPLELVHGDASSGWLAWSGVITPAMPDDWSPASRIGGLVLTDYIALEVRKTRNSASHPTGALSHTHAVPVKLVTDPFPHQNVVTGLDDQDLSALGLLF